ncbi:MAG: hypothetical protein AUK28_10680 [Desulfobacterales bacterium CG2_30_60_27]|nr:MAG: hypothetical protein AUK28_10680 [Desulfobacterales bacterium CG2_30_60_27]
MSGMHLRHNTKGFTLVELMVTVLVSSFVGGAIFAAFNAQHQSYLGQDAVSGMQTNIRAAMEMLVRDTRLAGYDWNGAITPRPTLFPDAAVVAPGSPSLLHMTMDLNADRDVADADEDIAYGFDLADDANDDGIADAGAAALGRRDATIVAGAFLPMADNFQAVAFAYAYDANGDGDLDFNDLNGDGVRDPGETTIWAADLNGDVLWENLDTNGDGVINAADKDVATDFILGTATGTTVDPSKIRAVRIWLLARAAQADPSYTDARTYVVGNKVITTNDNFRRRLLETTVACKNMGLQ